MWQKRNLYWRGPHRFTRRIEWRRWTVSNANTEPDPFKCWIWTSSGNCTETEPWKLDWAGTYSYRSILSLFASTNRIRQTESSSRKRQVAVNKSYEWILIWHWIFKNCSEEYLPLVWCRCNWRQYSVVWWVSPQGGLLCSNPDEQIRGEERNDSLESIRIATHGTLDSARLGKLCVKRRIGWSFSKI